MRVDLAFGKTGLTVDLPEGFRYAVLETRSAVPLDDPDSAIERALAALAGVAAGKRTAAISICDITRPAPNRIVLPHVLRALEQAGVPRDGITILIATGLHRPATEAEIREIAGEEIAAHYRIENHDARDFAAHRALGRTRSGTPVYIDERFVSADLHLTLGFIEPHLMLGYSGGRKLIVPGLAAQETIKVIHSPKFMREPKSVEGSIEDNPLHAELVEIASMARHDFILDVVLARDRRIAAVFAGDPIAAHRAGVRFVADTMLETLDEPVDAVITTSAGYPLDLTFYQSVKGITAASHIVKPGGKILLVSACCEGAGAAEFCRMLKESPSDREFLRCIAERSEVVVDQWQLEKLALVTARAELLMYVPGLGREYHAALWGRVFPSAPAAVEALTSSLQAGARIAVIPEGPYVLAKVGDPVVADKRLIEY